MPGGPDAFALCDAGAKDEALDRWVRSSNNSGMSAGLREEHPYLIGWPFNRIQARPALRHATDGETLMLNLLFSPRRDRTRPLRQRRCLQLEALEGRSLLTSIIATTTSFGYASDLAFGVGMQSDGKIVAAGVANFTSSYQSGSNLFGLAHYNPDLTLDTSFGNGGTRTTSLVPGFSSDAESLAIDTTTTANNGKIVLGGAAPSTFHGGQYWDFAVAPIPQLGPSTPRSEAAKVLSQRISPGSLHQIESAQ